MISCEARAGVCVFPTSQLLVHWGLDVHFFTPLPNWDVVRWNKLDVDQQTCLKSTSFDRVPVVRRQNVIRSVANICESSAHRLKIVIDSGRYCLLHVYIHLARNIADDRSTSTVSINVDALVAGCVAVGVQNATNSGQHLAVTFKQLDPIPQRSHQFRHVLAGMGC